MKFAFSDEEFSGMTFKKLEISSFSLKQLNYSPNIEIPKHSHEQANFCMAIEGGCTEFYGGKSREYTPFSLSFLPPGQTHSLKTSGEGMRSFSIEITTQCFERMRDYSLNIEDYVYCSNIVLIQLLLKLYEEFQNIDAASPLAIEGIALEMLAEISRYQIINKDNKAPYWLKQARDLVHEQFSSHLSLDAIAREIGVHPVHLARMFRKYYGVTMGDYLRKVRIENACRKIITTETPLIEIALTNGFSDQSHFTRIFRRLKGMTPAAYRAEFKAR